MRTRNEIGQEAQKVRALLRRTKSEREAAAGDGKTEHAKGLRARENELKDQLTELRCEDLRVADALRREPERWDANWPARAGKAADEERRNQEDERGSGGEGRIR